MIKKQTSEFDLWYFHHCKGIMSRSTARRAYNSLLDKCIRKANSVRYEPVMGYDFGEEAMQVNSDTVDSIVMDLEDMKDERL